MQQCVHVCAYACAECVPACACARACASTCARGRRERRAAQGGDLHLGIIVHMYIIICTRARMYTCVRALVECILARGRGHGRGRARWERRPLIVCHFVPLYRFIPIYECRYVLLYSCMLVYVRVCVCGYFIYIDIYLYIFAKVHTYIHTYICMYI
jgi:hypothetical protein